MKKRTSKETFGDALLALARSEDLERITVKQIVEMGCDVGIVIGVTYYKNTTPDAIANEAEEINDEDEDLDDDDEDDEEDEE